MKGARAALGLALLLAGAAPAGAGAAGPQSALARLMQEVGGRGATASPARYSYLAKLDSHLQDVAASRLGGGGAAAAAVAAQRQGVTVSAQGAALVDVYVEGDVARAADALRALGMRVGAVSDRRPQRMVEGWLPAQELASASELGSTEAIASVLSRLNVGAVTSQGDGAIDGPAARAPLGLGNAGAGVVVGIVSDSIDQQPPGGGIHASQSTGDLPPATVALSDAAGGTDEGRAMAEIVYDEAPNLSGIDFETAGPGPAAKAAAIDELVARGVQVIADDTTYLLEPFFQDDVVAQAVDRAKAAGVAYFAAAGNDSRNAWEGAFTPAPASAAEDFDPGPGVDTMQTLELPANVPAVVVLQWAEPWGGVRTNLDLDVYTTTGGPQALVGSSTSDNLLTGMPLEFVQVAAAGSARTLAIAIRRLAGSEAPFMKYIAFVNGPRLSLERPSSAGSIGPDAASSSGALTVAASDYGTPGSPEPFSSRGPVVHYFDAGGSALAAPDVRRKPDLAAPDDVATTVTGFSAFQGTSAATPAAAGIAALIRSARPGLPIDELYAIMTSPANALDCALSAGVPDPDCGAGFVLADRAVAMALDPTPPVVTPAVDDGGTPGANGWYTGPLTLSWSVADPDSPVIGAKGCGSASPDDGVTVFTCSATSAGGTASVPVTIRRDTTPPAALAISGIAARTYVPATLPKESAIRCRASDPTSGITGCSITGYSTALGAHTLRATVSDGAGLKATTTLRFAIARPEAISGLRVARAGLARLGSAGLSLRIRVAAPSTRIAATIVAKVPRASRRGTRLLTVGSMLRRNVGMGTHKLRIALTRHGRLALGALSRATLRITVSGSSPRAKTASLRASLLVRR